MVVVGMGQSWWAQRIEGWREQGHWNNKHNKHKKHRHRKTLTTTALLSVHLLFHAQHYTHFFSMPHRQTQAVGTKSERWNVVFIGWGDAQCFFCLPEMILMRHIARLKVMHGEGKRELERERKVKVKESEIESESERGKCDGTSEEGKLRGRIGRLKKKRAIEGEKDLVMKMHHWDMSSFLSLFVFHCLCLSLSVCLTVCVCPPQRGPLAGGNGNWESSKKYHAKGEQKCAARTTLHFITLQKLLSLSTLTLGHQTTTTVTC